MRYDIDTEKKEAMEAGRRALESLRLAENDLRSARNWGIWDMLGGGMFSTLIKQSKMNNARQNMERAKYDLRTFAWELGDVAECGLTLDTDDFLAFADFFFDGFFVDWMVQDRINHAAAQVSEAIRRVESILGRLQYS